MDSNIDLNIPILNSESETLFDLNEIPPTEEHPSNGHGAFWIDNNPG